LVRYMPNQQLRTGIFSRTRTFLKRYFPALAAALLSARAYRRAHESHSYPHLDRGWRFLVMPLQSFFANQGAQCAGLELLLQKIRYFHLLSAILTQLIHGAWNQRVILPSTERKS
jgi:hypothetical protein